MYGLDNASGVNVMPKIAPVGSATPLWFTEGGAGLAASYPGQDWFNMVQAELLGILTAAGVKPEKGKLTQLAEAISQIVSKAGYANGGVYTVRGVDAVIKTPNDSSSFEIGNTGWLAVKNLKTDTLTFTVSSSGVVGNCLIPIACGGTGAKNANDARINLNVYGKEEVDLALTGKQPSGNYANGDLFSTLGSSSIIKTPNKQGVFELGNTGWLSVRNESTGNISLSVSTDGVVGNCLVPIGCGGTGAKTAADARKSLGIQPLLFGIEQKWTNVLSSRAVNTLYANSTGKAIAISVTSASTTNSSAIEAYVDNEKIIGSGVSVTGGSCSVFMIIPPGSNYMIKTTNGNVYNWQELR